RKFRREPDRPVIAKVGAGASFARDRIIEAQRGVHAEGEGARGIVAEDVRDLPDQLGLRIMARGGGTVAENAPWAKLAQPREAGVGVGYFEETRLAISQREAQAVNFGRAVQCR